MVCRQTGTESEVKQVMAAPRLDKRGFHDVREEQALKTRKKKTEGAFDATRGVKEDLNCEWRAICDCHLSCTSLLSPKILFHFRKH